MRTTINSMMLSTTIITRLRRAETSAMEEGQKPPQIMDIMNNTPDHPIRQRRGRRSRSTHTLNAPTAERDVRTLHRESAMSTHTTAAAAAAFCVRVKGRKIWNLFAVSFKCDDDVEIRRFVLTSLIV